MHESIRQGKTVDILDDDYAFYYLDGVLILDIVNPIHKHSVGDLIEIYNRKYTVIRKVYEVENMAHSYRLQPAEEDE